MDSDKKAFFTLLDRAASKVNVNRPELFKIHPATASALFNRLINRHYNKGDLSGFVKAQVLSAGLRTLDKDAQLVNKLEAPEYIAFLVIQRARELANGTASESNWFESAERWQDTLKKAAASASEAKEETKEESEEEPKEDATETETVPEDATETESLADVHARLFAARAIRTYTRRGLGGDSFIIPLNASRRAKAGTVDAALKRVKDAVKDGAEVLFYQESYYTRVTICTNDAAPDSDKEGARDGFAPAKETTETAVAEGIGPAWMWTAEARFRLLRAGVLLLGDYIAAGGRCQDNLLIRWSRPADRRDVAVKSSDIEYTINKVLDEKDAGNIAGLSVGTSGIRVYFSKTPNKAR